MRKLFVVLAALLMAGVRLFGKRGLFSEEHLER